MHEKPAEAVRAKPDSSLVAACRAVGAGDADAVVSAGNTGAMLAAGLLHIRRLPGVLRPAIAVVVPGTAAAVGADRLRARTPTRGPSTCSSSRTWASSSPRRSSTSPNPGCACSRSARSAEKGNQLTLEAHELLAASDLDFAGNTEARDLLRGAADVVVTDGFTGNVALKLLEGTISELLDALRDEIGATGGASSAAC